MQIEARIASPASAFSASFLELAAWRRLTWSRPLAHDLASGGVVVRHVGAGVVRRPPVRTCHCIAARVHQLSRTDGCVAKMTKTIGNFSPDPSVIRGTHADAGSQSWKA